MTADELAQHLLPMLEELVMVLAELRGNEPNEPDESTGPGDERDDDDTGAPTSGPAFIPLASFQAGRP